MHYSGTVRYFVTGGAGFIGSNYVEYLFENVPDMISVTIYDKFTYAANSRNFATYLDNPRLRVVKGDICELEQLNSAMAGHDFVIHFAAESHVDRSIKNSTDFVTTNIMGTLNVLEAARKNSVKTVIHVSTDEVYGSISRGAARETNALAPNSPYAASKASSDLVVRSYVVTHGLDVRITRCSNNYGKHQYPEKVIPLFIKKLLAHESLPIYGQGRNIREWIHVADHCRAIQTVLVKGKKGEIYNVGSKHRLSNIELAKLLISELGLDDSFISFVEDRQGHDFRYSLHDQKIRKLGHKNQIDLRSGIRQVVEWYKQNPNWWET